MLVFGPQLPEMKVRWIWVEGLAKLLLGLLVVKIEVKSNVIKQFGRLIRLLTNRTSFVYTYEIGKNRQKLLKENYSMVIIIISVALSDDAAIYNAKKHCPQSTQNWP